MPAWSVVALLSIAVVSGCTATGSVEDPSRLEFVSHATFFSAASGRPDVIDPQVFVASPGAPAATGLQDIAHVENVSYASPSAALATRLLTATGRPLELTVGDWYFARGSVTFDAQADGSQRLSLTLGRLKPAGVYSLFTTHPDRSGYEPLDGAGESNTFVADGAGNASITVVAPRALTHDGAVLVVYHSDGQAHGATRGAPGIDAHDQLIARVP